MKIRLFTLVKEGAGGLLNLIYPPLCAICGSKLDERENSLSICKDCLNKMKKNLPPYCKRCGRSLHNLVPSVEVCWECFGRDFYYERAWSCFLYEGAAKEALHLLKYSKKFSLINLFCSSLNKFLGENAEILNGIEGVAAVPLHSVKLREREFNQALILAMAIVKEFNIKNLSGCLKRSVATKPQSELNRDERLKNVKGTFEVARPVFVSGKNLLLVDDLFTTGATLNECARVLRKAGAGKIHCLTFARGA